MYIYIYESTIPIIHPDLPRTTSCCTASAPGRLSNCSCPLTTWNLCSDSDPGG